MSRRCQRLAAVLFVLGVPDAPPEFLVDSVRDSELRGTVAGLTAENLQLADGRRVPSEQIICMRQAGAPPATAARSGPCALGQWRLRSGPRGYNRQRQSAGCDGRRREGGIQRPADRLIGAVFHALQPLFGPLGQRAAARIAQPRSSDLVRLVNGDTIAGAVDRAPRGRSSPDRSRRPAGGGTARENRCAPPQLSTRQDRQAQRDFSTDHTAERRQTHRDFGECRSRNAHGEDPFRRIDSNPSESTVRNEYARRPGCLFIRDEAPALRVDPLSRSRLAAHEGPGVRGNDLRLGGGSYDNGLGLHSAAAATYAIPAGTIRFECTAGLDEETGRRGSVILRIQAQGRTLVKDLELSGGDAPRSLHLPLTSADKELTIEIGFGRGGDVQDDVDLVDARFVVSPAGR